MDLDDTGLGLWDWVSHRLKSGLDHLVSKENKKTLEVS